MSNFKRNYILVDEFNTVINEDFSDLESAISYGKEEIFGGEAHRIYVCKIVKVLQPAKEPILS